MSITVQSNQREPTGRVQELKKKLLDTQEENMKLASENAALKEQMASKESNWQQWKARMQRDAVFKSRVQTELETLKKEREEVIGSLWQSLLAEQEKSRSAKEQLKHITVHYEAKWHQGLRKMALEHLNHERKMSQVIQEKDDLIMKITDEKKALEAQNVELKARLEEMEREKKRGEETTTSPLSAPPAESVEQQKIQLVDRVSEAALDLNEGTVTEHSKKRKLGGEQKNDGQYVKKPPNGFMLFVREQRPNVTVKMDGQSAAGIHAILGQMWRSLSTEEKAKYKQQAEEEKHLHAQKHPGWSAGLNYGKKKIPRTYKRKASEQSEASAPPSTSTSTEVTQLAKKPRVTTTTDRCDVVAALLLLQRGDEALHQ